MKLIQIFKQLFSLQLVQTYEECLIWWKRMDRHEK